MIITILVVAVLGAYSLANRLSPEQQPFVLGLIFGLAALAVVVQGATDAYTAKQARLRRQAEGPTAWPGESEEDDKPEGPALNRAEEFTEKALTRADGRNLAKDRDRG